MKVSVCIVSYNQEKYIEDCLQSVVSQVCDFPFEILISDDASTDRTPKIIEEFSRKYKNIRIIPRDKNIGPYKNFIDTHNRAIGEFVCHLDGDDRWLPGKIQRQVEFLESHPDYSVVWSKANYFDDSGRVLKAADYKFSAFPDGVVTLGQALRLGSFAVHSSIMYRRSARQTKNTDLRLLDLFYTWEYLTSGFGKIMNDVSTEYRVFSAGALSVNGNQTIRRFSCEHASYFLKRYGQYRKDIFIFAILNFMYDLKNWNRTMIDFFVLAMKSISIISISDLLNAYRVLKLRAVRLP